MYLLSKPESKFWTDLSKLALEDVAFATVLSNKVNLNLLPALYFFLGTLLASEGKIHQAKKMLSKGRKENLPCNTVSLDFMERYGNLKILKPKYDALKLFNLKSSIPEVKIAEEKFVSYAYRCLPSFSKPLKVLNIGCGDGRLLIEFLKHLLRVRKVHKVQELLLVDPSSQMLKVASENISKVFEDVEIKTINKKLQDINTEITSVYDIAFCPSSLHHLPYDEKIKQLKKLQNNVNNFLLFEDMANFDISNSRSPELALAVYLLYGQKIKCFFAQKPDEELRRGYIDHTIIPEIITLLTKTQDHKIKHHLLRHQWHEVFNKSLDQSFSCLCDSVCYADKFIESGFISYGR